MKTIDELCGISEKEKCFIAWVRKSRWQRFQEFFEKLFK